MTGPFPSDPEMSDDAPLTPELVGVVGEDGDSLPEEKRRGQLRQFLETLGGFAPRKPKPEPQPSNTCADARLSACTIRRSTSREPGSLSPHHEHLVRGALRAV